MLRKISALDPETIIGLDPECFAIVYGEVVSLALEPKDLARSRITLLTRDMKIELSASRVAMEGVRDSIVLLLGEKIVAEL